MLLVGRVFEFEAAHHLPNYKGPCQENHGHSYRLLIEVDGESDEYPGMVCDFGTLKDIVEEKILCVLDHSDINELMWDDSKKAIDPPIAENIVKWIVDELKNNLQLVRVRLWETSKCYAEWRRDKV